MKIYYVLEYIERNKNGKISIVETKKNVDHIEFFASREAAEKHSQFILENWYEARSKNLQDLESKLIIPRTVFEEKYLSYPIDFVPDEDAKYLGDKLKRLANNMYRHRAAMEDEFLAYLGIPGKRQAINDELTYLGEIYTIESNEFLLKTTIQEIEIRNE